MDAVFDPAELAAGPAFRQSIPPDLTELLRHWTQGFCPLNAIERSISDLIDARESNPVQRIAGALTAEDAIAMLEPGDVLIDCTGSRSLLRDRLMPGSDGVDGDANTLSFVFEHALVVTFLYSQTYSCNEYCKYYKNVENPHYKFIPMVSRVSYDGTMSHVTGIVTISPEEYAANAGPVRRRVASRPRPDAARSMERFIDKIKEETSGEVIGDLAIIRMTLAKELGAAEQALATHRSSSGAAQAPA